jgi:hypothetical protein
VQQVPRQNVVGVAQQLVLKNTLQHRAQLARLEIPKQYSANCFEQSVDALQRDASSEACFEKA